MASDGKKLQPIIVKRVKKGGHAAHGGAWKIAYADFVTAMMAFFLLMWLLGSTAKGDLQGIAAHFNMPLKVALMGGNGAGSSNSILPGGGKDIRESYGQQAKSDGELHNTQPRKPSTAEMRAQLAKQDAARLVNLQEKIRSMLANNPKLAEFGSQIKLEVTPDGLLIQIADDQNRPMFDSGSALVKPYMRDILREIGGGLDGVENRIALSGHTDSAPYGSGERGYSNWELSAERANASRRELVAGGMNDARLARVVGLSSSDLLEPDKPTSPVNRRITILVLTREADARLSGKPLPVDDAPEADAASPSPEAVPTAPALTVQPAAAPGKPAAP